MFDVEIPSLIVASPKLEDPKFRQSLILLTHTNAEGSVGFVVNHLSQYELQQVVDDQETIILPSMPAWEGGPVEPLSACVLYKGIADEKGEQITSEIAISTDKQAIKGMVEQYSCESENGLMYPYRLVMGYAGWAVGQLEFEIQAGFWHQLPVDQELLFGTAHESMWGKALARAGVSLETFTPHTSTLLN